MITLTDQILLTNVLSLDYRASNVIVSGNDIVVETIPEYLHRIDILSRYIGLEVHILSPSGTYGINDFVDKVTQGTITGAKYKFINISDAGLILINDSITVINDLTTGGVTDALSAEQGKVLKAMIESSTHIELTDTPDTYTGNGDKIEVVNSAEDGLVFMDRTFIYEQGTPDTIWNIAHTLHKYPAVIVKDSAGSTVEGEIAYIDKTHLKITFNAAFSGTAVLN